MKKKISKILGVAITLVMVCSLTAAFSVPVMADEEEWDLFEPPDAGSDGDWFMSTDIGSLGPLAKAINDDLYLYVGMPSLTATLAGGSTNTAEWSTAQKHSGSSSAKLTNKCLNFAYVKFTPPTVITLAEFVAAPTTYGFFYMRTVDSVGPQLELTFTDPDNEENFAEITVEAALYDYLTDDLLINVWIKKTLTASSLTLFYGDYATKQFEYTVPSGALSGVAAAIAASTNGPTAAEVNIWEMTKVLVDFGWVSGNPPQIAYIDDVRIDGVTYDLEGEDGSLDPGTALGSYLMISDDEGRTWEETDYAADTDGSTITAIAVSSEDEDILYVADATNVYKTDDAGDSWEDLGAVDDDTSSLTTINCLAVGYADDIPHLFVGGECSTGDGEVFYYKDAPFASVWTDLDVCAPDNSIAIDSSDVWGIATSPDFDSDTLVVAVIQSGSQSFVSANVGAGIGEENWDDLELLNDTPASFAITDATNPVFVEDFDIDDSYELFVGVEGLAHATAGGVYRITGTSEDDDFLLDDVDDDIASLDLVGDLGGASLLAGTNDAGTATKNGSVWYSTDDGDTWDETDKEPSGVGVVSNLVIVAEDFADSGEAWCAANATTREGGVHRTTDFGATWNGISLLDTNMAGAVYDIAFTADYGTDDAPMFMVTESDEDAGADNSVWKYDGDNWERVWLDTLDLDLVEVSPAYAEDTAVFIAASLAPEILRSDDGGADFTAMVRDPDEPITAWLVIDDETIITGDASGDYWKTSRYGRRVWDTGTISDGDAITDFALSPNYALDGTILAGNDDSEVFISFDEGEEWDEVSGSDIEGWTTNDNDTYVAFDTRYADNSMIYAASDDIVARCEIDTGEDMGDLEFDNLSGTSVDEPAALTTVAGASGIVVADDGTQAGEDVATLYVLDAVTGAVAVAANGNGGDAVDEVLTGVWRCLNPADTLADVIFELASAELIIEDFSPVVGSIRNLELAGGSNVLYAIASAFPDTAAIPAVIYTYEDTLAAPVVLSSPADEAKLGDTDRIQFEWDELNTTVDEYELQVNEEDDFPSATDADIPDVDDTEYVWRDTADLDLLPEPGTTYYWRVRVAEGDPVLSRWSEEWSCMTKVSEVAEPVDVIPLPGAQNVILMPTFAWKAVTGADTYDILVATDPEFESLVTSGVASINTWLCGVELDYATAYYWKVRGISATGAPEGDWIISSFTTMVEPEEAAAPVEVVEVTPAAPEITVTLPTPETPAYVWAIIGIGALLVIALIILIVRTRRVV